MQFSKKSKFSPKQNYAITNAKIVTIYQGKRIVKTYQSGERLTGRLLNREDNML